MSAITAEVLPSTGVYDVDSVHSDATFSVRHHAVATFRNSFTNLTGSYDAAAGKLVGEVAVSDITLVGLEPLKGHLQTPAFFDAEQRPLLSFESTSIAQNGEKLDVDGQLTLRGVTKPVHATGSWHPAGVVNGPGGLVTERFGIDLTTTIDRRDFGINFNNEVAEGIINLGWDVKIEVSLELFRAVEN